jgi:GAF domain-containing protein
MADADAGQLAELALSEGASLTRSRVAYLALLNEDESVQVWYGWSGSPGEGEASAEDVSVEVFGQNGEWSEAVRQRQPVILNEIQGAAEDSEDQPAHGDYRKWDRHPASMTGSQSGKWDRHPASMTGSQSHFPGGLQPPVDEGHRLAACATGDRLAARATGESHFRRGLHVPVLDGDRIVAVAGVADKPQAYDESDVQHLAVLMQSVCRLIQRQQAARRSERLTAVISAIRNVNQLISREKDVPRLLEAACQAMVEGGAYRSAWIGRLDDSLRLVDHCQSGTDGSYDSVTDQWRDGRWSELGREVLAQNRVEVLPHAACLAADAPAGGDGSRPALASRLEYRDHVYGLLIVQNRRRMRRSMRRRAIAVRGIGWRSGIGDVQPGAGPAAAARRAVLTAGTVPVGSLLKLGQMTDVDLQTITDFALEEAVRLTQSQIGYLAFTTEDESVLIMHSWSKTAMKECAIIDKPIEYPVVTTGLWGEAVRQRRPVITNDYAAPILGRKAIPEAT